MKKESEIQKKKTASLKESLKEGAAANIPVYINDTFIPQLALALKATSFQIGLISAISGLVGPFGQYFGERLMENKTRKQIVSSSVILEILFFIPIAILGYLSFIGFFREYLIYGLIFSYSLLIIFHNLHHPAWFSWMGDLVPEKERGKFFSTRYRIARVTSLIVILFGFMLDAIESEGLVLLGFSSLFIIAAIFRSISLHYMNKQYEPKLKLRKNYYFSIGSFIKRFDEVGKFAFYHALFNGAVMIASPFFAVHMRENLDFSYLTITVISLSQSVFYIIFAPIAGRFSDKYGNVRLFYIGSLLLTLNPLLWIFIKSPIALVFIPQLIVGIANAALAISVTNFMYNMVSKQRRALCISYVNIMTGVAIFFGALLGGLLMNGLTVGFMQPIIVVFLVSTILRFAISFGYISKIKEQEKVKPVPKISVEHPLRTVKHELEWLKHLYR